MPRREFVLKRPFDGPTTNFIATSIQLQASTMVRCTIALLIDILVVSATLSWPQAVLRQVPVSLWRLQDVPWIRDGIAILRPSPTDTNTALRNCLFIDHCQRCLVHLQCALLWESNSRLTCSEHVVRVLRPRFSLEYRTRYTRHSFHENNFERIPAPRSV